MVGVLWCGLLYFGEMLYGVVWCCGVVWYSGVDVVQCGGWFNLVGEVM